KREVSTTYVGPQKYRTWSLLGRRIMATATDKALQKTEEAKSQPAQQEKPKQQQPHRARLDDKLKIFCGTANEPLTQEICDFLGIHRGQIHLTRFADGEVYLQLLENVRGS